MFCEYIKIAVSHILSEHRDGIERCCGSCNPSCDDLTRFICFGHTISEIETWIKNNPDLLTKDYQKMFDDMEGPEVEFYEYEPEADEELSFG